MMFGCTGASPSTQKQPTAPGTTQPGTTTPTVPTQNTTQQGTVPPNTQNTTQPNGGTTTPGSVVDVAGKTLTQLITANLPVKCTITVEGSPPMTVYMKGDERYAMEIPLSGNGASCTKSAVMKIGQKVYLGCKEGKMFPGSTCDWLEMEYNASSVSSTTTTLDTYENMPDVKTQCEPWIYDESKFVLPLGAKTCTMETLYQMPTIPS